MLDMSESFQLVFGGRSRYLWWEPQVYQILVTPVLEQEMHLKMVLLSSSVYADIQSNVDGAYFEILLGSFISNAGLCLWLPEHVVNILFKVLKVTDQMHSDVIICSTCSQPRENRPETTAYNVKIGLKLTAENWSLLFVFFVSNSEGECIYTFIHWVLRTYFSWRRTMSFIFLKMISFWLMMFIGTLTLESK